jgi:hypothetical protein
MLRFLTLLTVAAALAGALAQGVGARPSDMDGAVQPHAVQIVVSGPDAVSRVRYESGADGAAAGAGAEMKVVVRRVVHEGDPAGARTLLRECLRKTEEAAARVDPLAPMLRS